MPNVPPHNTILHIILSAIASLSDASDYIKFVDTSWTPVLCTGRWQNCRKISLVVEETLIHFHQIFAHKYFIVQNVHVYDRSYVVTILLCT